MTKIIIITTKTLVIESIDECIKEDILSDFFIKHRNKRINVNIFEYDKKVIIDILRKEARKKSRAQALTEGLKNVLKMNVMKQP